MEKKDSKYILLICSLVFILVISFLLSNKIFGSTTDWLSQHTVYPDYFRNLFYKTGNLFPDFSINLGAGENIFYFSYYGLFNPIIMFSYLLPFISMQNYIIITSVVGILVSMILLYYFLKDKLGEELSFISSILYLLSGPIIFQAHRHIMFTNYMPFLILGLIGVDKYFKNKNKSLIIISTFLMILTSYYYSISGIIVLAIYGIYVYLKQNDFKIKNFLKEALHFFIPIFLGILLSCFFLLPTAYSLLSGRVENTNSISIINLFIPSFNLNNFLYSNYSLGLTSIFILTLIYFIIDSKKENKFLGITLSFLCLIPFGVYILNGTLYARFKSLIPFLPLAILMIGIFIKNFNYSIKKVFWLILLIFLFIISFLYLDNTLFFIDICILLISLIIYSKYNSKKIIYIPLLITALVNVLIFNQQEKYVPNDYNTDGINSLVDKIDNNNSYRTSIQNDTLNGLNRVYSYNQLNTSIYSSTYNSNYYDFYTKIFDNSLSYRNKLMLNTTKNILFETLMAEKYIVRKCNDSLLGYDILDQDNEYCLYENKNVFTLGYGSSNLYSNNYFDSLEYPYNIELLLNGIIVNNKKLNNKLESKIEKVKLNGTIDYDKNKLSIRKGNDLYIVDSKDETTITFTLNDKLENKILIIDFDLLNSESCDIGDTFIMINGIKNKLTCTGYEYDNKNNHMTYILNYKELEKLSITFNKGNFQIKDIKTNILDYDNYINLKNNIYMFTNIKYFDNLISGNIFMEKDGYFVLNIPYDKGFTITVDEEEIEYEKANLAFIGFDLSKGKHSIKIEYKAPLFIEGKIISIITLLSLVGLFMKGKFKWKK